MPDSVRISELSLRSAVSDDVLPAVDSTFNSTVRVTAASIAAIGGGPPGDNTVTTSKIANNSVTAAKLSFTGPDKLISRIAAGAGEGVEITLTPYARGLLESATAANARTYLDALQTTNNPTFTGQVRLGRGSIGAPALVPTDDPGTGVFFPIEDALAVASQNVESFRIQANGQLLTPIPGFAGIRPGWMARAWVNFSGLAAAGTLYQIVANQTAVAARYGLSGTIGDNLTTRNYMQSVETARGLTLTFPTTPSFSDAYGKGTFPRYNLGTETRANFTSPGNNTHWVWNGSQWVTTDASSLPWIGTIDLTTPANASPVREAGGIASITRLGTGSYRLNFSAAMPDTNYVVVGICSENGATSSGVLRLSNFTTTSVQIATSNSINTTLFDSSTICVAIFR